MPRTLKTLQQLVIFHHSFMSAGGLFLDSKQLKCRVRNAKLNLNKDTGISCTFRAVFSATSRYSHTSKFLTWHIKGAVSVVSALGLLNVCDPSLWTQWKRSPCCKLQQALETVNHSISCISQASTCFCIPSGWMQGTAKHTPSLQVLSPACTLTVSSDVDRQHGSWGRQDPWPGDAPAPLPAWCRDVCCPIVLAGLGCTLCSSTTIKAVHNNESVCRKASAQSTQSH